MKIEIPTLAMSTLWIGGSQAVIRLGRILSTIVVARMIAPELLGVVAIALAVNEFAHVVAKNVTNNRIIRADEKELPEICATAYYLNWTAGFALFLLQIALGYGVSVVYNNPILFYLIGVLALSYLILPIAQVQSALNLRLEKIGLISKTEIQQTIVDSLLTVVMVLLGFGVWSLVVPKVLVVLVWVKAHLKGCDWVCPKRITFHKMSEHLQFNSSVLGVELLSVVRHNIDYVLIGYFLGMQALGIYYFAFNAGLGITRGLILSLNNALYPHFCAVKSNQEALTERFKKGLRYMLLLMLPILGVQAVFAEFYVPILYGEKWNQFNAAQLVSLLCLTGFPLVVMEASTQFMRAQGLAKDDLRWQLGFTLIFSMAVLVGAYFELIGVVLSILLVQFIAAFVRITAVMKAQKNNDTNNGFDSIQGVQ